MTKVNEAEKQLFKIKQQVERCKKCNLSKTRIKAVAGEGSFLTKIIFIGEAPGKNEDHQGRPFVGRAGKLLDELLQFIGLERKQIFITNILKCRPPKNRNPLKNEIKMCTYFLDEQIELIKPKIIVSLGNYASTYLLNKYNIAEEKIGDVHGKVFCLDEHSFKTILIPIYHPAAAVYNPNLKEILKQDFKSIDEALLNISKKKFP
jgi:DNA polymerase